MSTPRSSSRLAPWGTLGALLAGAAWIAAAAVAYSGIASGEPPYSYLDEAAYGVALDWLPGLGLLGLLLGFVLTGVATFRAGLLPKWCGLLLIVCLPSAGVLAGALGETGAGTALGLSWLALGYALWPRRDLSAFLRSSRR